jgi:hypothetical protein
MSAPQVTHWQAANPPTESLLMEIMKQQGLNPSSWSSRPHDTFSLRKHNYLKVIYVVRGSITYAFPVLKMKVPLKVGDRLELPAGLVYSVEVGADGVTCLEGHIE